MRRRKGLGPAPRPQPDNSRPSSPAVPPEPRRLTPRLPRSRGAAAAGPHAAMPGDAARGHGAAGKTQALSPHSPPWTSPPPAARRPRPLHCRHPETGSHLQTWAPSVLPWPASTSGSLPAARSHSSAVRTLGCTEQSSTLPPSPALVNHLPFSPKLPSAQDQSWRIS